MTTGPRAALDRIEAGSVPWSLRSRTDGPLAPLRLRPSRVLTAGASAAVEETLRTVLVRLDEAPVAGATLVEGALGPEGGTHHARRAWDRGAPPPHAARAALTVDGLAPPIAPTHRPGPTAPTGGRPVLGPSDLLPGGKMGEGTRSAGEGPASPRLPAPALPPSRSASSVRGGATPVVPAAAIDRAGLREMVRGGWRADERAGPHRPLREDATAPHPGRDSLTPTTAVRPLRPTSGPSPSPRRDQRQAPARWPTSPGVDGGRQGPQSLAELVEWAERGQAGAAPPQPPEATVPVARAWPGAGAASQAPKAGRDAPRPDGPARPSPAGDLAWATDVVEAVLVSEAVRHGVTVEYQ